VTQSQFQAVPAGATAIAIFADWRSGPTDDTALDTVVLTDLNVSAVPVPAALPLFASALGLAGLFGYTRKRKAA
jgi:hypothetical protein